jgi:hypothetical protein
MAAIDLKTDMLIFLLYVGLVFEVEASAEMHVPGQAAAFIPVTAFPRLSGASHVVPETRKFRSC